MNLSRALRQAGEKRATNQFVEPLIPGRPAYSSPAGVVVSPETAIRMSTVYACVRLLGDTISSLPMSAYVRRGRQRISYAAVYGDVPAWVNKPNSELTRMEFLEQVLASLNLKGNAYILTVRDDLGDVVELYCINPESVRIVRKGPNEPLVYEVTVKEYDPAGGVYSQDFNQKVMTLTKDELLHIPLFLLPGSLYGLGPIEAARITVGAVMAADTYAASYFGNAANPGGIIEVPGEMTEEQATSIGRDWNITHSGPYRAGKIGVLTGGAQFKPLALNAQDAQLLDTRRFGLEEIARLFRVPISLLGHPVAGAMSFASVEAQNLSFVQHSLRPLLERIEQALSSLLPEKDGFIKFNLDALLRGTTIERYDSYTKGLREGFLSLNDVRATEDLSPLGEAGDQYRVPLQNIDAADAKDVGLKLRTEIAAQLIQVGFDPAAVNEAVGLPKMKHTGVPSSQLQQVSTIDPNDPGAVYEVKSRRNDNQQTVVNVPEPTVNVSAPNVTVEPAMVMLESPEVNVAAPNVNVEAPTVQVTNTIERKRVRKKVKRDKQGRIDEIVEEFMEGDE
jgi:HK97 family phage portal protein